MLPINKNPDDSERDTVFVSIANQASGQSYEPAPFVELSASEDPFIGSIIGNKYQIQEKIGQGGMSIVYRAMQVTMNRIVALKMLKMGLSTDPVFIQRFSREVAFLGRLNHRNIVTVFDSGVSSEGYLYLAMDLLSGPTLQEILDRNETLPLARAQNIILQICDALNHAHKRDIIHRDLKPGNIIIEDDGKGCDVVKIVDFGLAKMGEGSERLTKAGELWGSSFYMSPEQCSGEESDARSDIYSFGILIYYMLCGKLPFRGNSFMETVAKQVNESPPAIKQSNPNALVNDDLENVIMRCLKKTPSERFQTVSELKIALSAIFPASAQTTSEANSARHISNVMPKPKSPPRSLDIKDHDKIQTKSSNAMIIVIAVVLILLAGGGAFAFFMFGAKPTTPQAVPKDNLVKTPIAPLVNPADAGLKTVPLVVPKHAIDPSLLGSGTTIKATTKSSVELSRKSQEHNLPAHKAVKVIKRPVRQSITDDDDYVGEPKVRPRREKDAYDYLR